MHRHTTAFLMPHAIEFQGHIILHLDIPWFFVNLRRQTATKLETEGEMESDMESDMEEKGKGVLITQGWQDRDTLDLTNASQQNMVVFSCTVTPPFRKSILYPLVTTSR